jgi:hypothetical protein
LIENKITSGEAAMNRCLFIIITFSIALFASTSWSITLAELEIRSDGRYYEQGSYTPYNGWVSGTERGQFVDGKEEGVWEFHYRSGQLFSMGAFINGQNHGTWKHYDPDGRVYKVDTWDFGRLIRRDKY